MGAGGLLVASPSLPIPPLELAPNPRMNRRVLIIGVDALDRDVVSDIQKRLPNITRLQGSGADLPLRSVFPPDSCPAWASVYLGASPATHGIINFLNFADKKDGYKPGMSVDDAMFQGKTFWDIAAKAGKRCHILMPLNIAPGWEIPGRLITRGGSPADVIANLQDGDTLQQPLDSKALLGIGSGFVGRKDLPKAEAGFKKQLAAEIKLGSETFGRDDWDLGFIYLSGLDGLQHMFWADHDPKHPGYIKNGPHTDVINQGYEAVDDAVGKLIEAAGEDVTVILLADHGHGPRPWKLFQVNEWLRQHDFLTLKKGSKKPRIGAAALKKMIFTVVRRFGTTPTLMKISKRFPIWKKLLAPSSSIDWEQTRAYVSDLSTVKSYSYGGIRINRSGLTEAEIDVLIDEVIAVLKTATHEDGKPLFVSVLRREDYYDGPELDKFPEILVRLPDWIGLGWETKKGLWGEGSIHLIHPGSHRFDTPICTISDPSILHDSDRTVELMDIAPSVLELLGVEFDASQFDGQSFIKEHAPCPVS
jgi:predicted AlkP superfamily phosphohydrolase/phosphomutase